MAKLRLGEKAERVLKLLLGLRNKKIATALAARGFGADDLEEGFALLRGVTGVALEVLPKAPANPAIILDIDRWENEWFPVADATLARHFPEVHARVFLNLSQTEGAGVIISVGTFIERIEALTKAEGGHGQAGKDARKLLARRGLDKTVVDEAKALLAKVESIEDQPAALVDLEEEKARLAKAEQAMWAWYLEWGAIARASIKDRSLLRQLGFLSSSQGGGGRGGGGRGGGEDEGDEDDDDQPGPAGGASA